MQTLDQHFDSAGLRQTAASNARAAQTARQVPDHSAGVMPTLLTDDQAARCLGVSRRKFHQLRAQDWMPRPIVLGPRIVRWARAELEHAVASMPRQAQATEPASLRRARIESLKRGAAA